MDSDLMIAVALGIEKRNSELEEFVEYIKEGALLEDKERIINKLETILKINENIKVMESAAVAVTLYKLEQEKNINK